MNDRIGVIESPIYAQTRARLVEDPIVQAMAHEMIADLGSSAALARVGGDTGHIPFAFMTAALAEYDRRGGTRSGHIGGVAEAMVTIIRDAHTQGSSPETHCPDCRVVVTDHVSYFGVHLADCGYWDDRCHRCHKLIPAGTASPQRHDLCRSCAEDTLTAPEEREPS